MEFPRRYWSAIGLAGLLIFAVAGTAAEHRSDLDPAEAVSSADQPARTHLTSSPANGRKGLFGTGPGSPFVEENQGPERGEIDNLTGAAGAIGADHSPTVPALRRLSLSAYRAAPPPTSCAYLCVFLC